jgi:hypothetical protein
MGRKSKAMSVIQADFVGDHPAAATQRYEITETLTEDLQSVIAEIDQIFGDVQVASLTAFWRVGHIITDVRNNPEIYLTQEQINNNIDGASLLISIFAPVYTAEQLRSAVGFFEKYPSEGEVTRLLNLRCPERPRWRMTVSHVQLLAQVPDEDQRTALEDKCAEDGYTARNLALELQELRGRQKKNSGRTHQAPKGLKQQLLDLLQYQRRFITRSEKLWLADDSVYDEMANTSPEKLDAAILSHFAELRENFNLMADAVASHVEMCRKVQENVVDQLDNENATEEEEEETQTPRRRQSDITR